ncbi:MAG: hypothetical protein HYX79_01555 [Chloroflexi bacterium]|nr:hypothetical protein [Chloroflexota bacterium]
MGQRRRFRELMMAYHDTVSSVTRIKNKIKAKFLQNGIQCSGETVYLPEHRETWRQRLPQEPALLVIIDRLWEQLDQTRHTEEAILSEARVQAKQYPEIKLLNGIAGDSAVFTNLEEEFDQQSSFADRLSTCTFRHKVESEELAILTKDMQVMGNKKTEKPPKTGVMQVNWLCVPVG